MISVKVLISVRIGVYKEWRDFQTLIKGTLSRSEGILQKTSLSDFVVRKHTKLDREQRTREHAIFVSSINMTGSRNGSNILNHQTYMTSME